jgi:antitoxin component of MazEF toxin-antitoxin module
MADSDPQNLLWEDYKTVRKVGNSLVVGLPAPFVRKSGLGKGDRVKLVYTGNSITISTVVEPEKSN